MRDLQYTIPFVLDCETGEEVYAMSFFKQDEAAIFDVRRQLEEAIRNRRDPKYKCYYCQQLIKIRGKAANETKLKRMHFAHQWDSDVCPIKTGQKLTQQQIWAIKYNGQKESALHERTKRFVATALESNRLTNKGVTEVAIETVRRDTSGLLSWRKPDVSAVYLTRQLVFEIQLATTFLSVIADREHFYRQNQTFILWVFKSFSDELDKQRFTEKDVFYGNNQHAFVFDEEAMDASKHQQDLILKCYYREPYRSGSQVAYRWQERLISLRDLTFDEQNYKVSLVDVEGATDLIQKQIDTDDRAAWAQQEELAQRQHVYEQRREAYELARDEGFSRARSSVYQTLTEVHAYPERRSPLLREFAEFSQDTERNLFNLFGLESGYQPTELDKTFLTTAFERERKERAHLERNDLLTCLCLAICLVKLKSPQKTHRLKKIHGAVLALLSVKLNCVLGQKFTTLVQVAHTVFPGKEAFAHLFLRAIELYPRSELTEQDAQSGGKLARKIAAFQQKNVKLEQGYDDVLRVLFPEFFQ